jgi:hypothetical protein
VNKLLHTPTTRIKAMAGDPRGTDLVKAVEHVFDLVEIARELGAGKPTPVPPSPDVVAPSEMALGAETPDRETAGR